MATLFSGHYYYKNGVGGHSSVIGFESKSNRVMRIDFVTGNVGATSISISVEAGCIQCQDGAELTKIPFYVTESSTSHADANEEDGYAVTGYITGSSNKAYSGSANVILKANTTYYVWFFPPNKKYGWSYWHRNTDWYKSYYECSGTSKFGLSISAGTGSSITVNRTSSAVGLATGNLSNGAEIYKDDKLKITFTPSANYAIKTRTVNGSAFTSGNTHTVSGNVSVVATAQVLASNVGATDANIGSTSTITVTKYNDTYYHTLQYSFAGLSGYITSSGEVSSSPVKISTTSIAFNVPASFYNAIPNSKSGVCTITCRTYESASSSTQLGNNTTCTFTATAAASSCNPVVTGSVIDTNTVTTALTGDSSKLIKYKSNAQCTITATARMGSSITSRQINGAAPSESDNSRVFSSVTANEFTFTATDSRGYSNGVTVRPQIISYILLTCNPEVYRPVPTGSRMALSVSGNVYRGSFGAYSNTLTLKYRYRKVGESYGSWKTVNQSYLTIGHSSYRSNVEIELEAYSDDGFDYRQDYEFQVKATDGANGYTLSDVTKTVSVSRGLPVFDWGRDDFNINASLKLKEVNILDIMYPVGSVYMHSSDGLPNAVSEVGTWVSISTGIDGVYAWKRQA